MAANRTGDWAAIQARLANPVQKMKKAVSRASLKSALLLRREIVKGIKTQAPGGEAFAPLAESTIDRKKSSKALIDTGFLINKITQRVNVDEVFVGLLRGTVGPDGEDRANIGAIMEYGATINMPNGTTIIIPARPFLAPVFKKHRKEIQDIYKQAIFSVIS